MFPTYLLPAAYAKCDSSSEWAERMETRVLDVLKKHVEELGRSWDDRLRLSHAHTLDQSKTGASFKWHRDNEENHRGRRILWSMVVALRMDTNNQAADMTIAGASDASCYNKVGDFHVFDATLVHSTVESERGGLKLGLFFATPW